MHFLTEEIPGSVPIFWSAAMDRNQRFSKVLMWAESSRASSQVITSYWVHQWCSPSADCNRKAGRLYKVVAVPLLSGCVSSGSQHNQLAFCLSENLSRVRLIFFCFFPDSFPQWFHLRSNPFVLLTCWWSWVAVLYSHRPLLDTKGPVTFVICALLC